MARWVPADRVDYRADRQARTRSFVAELIEELAIGGAALVVGFAIVWLWLMVRP